MGVVRARLGPRPAEAPVEVEGVREEERAVVHEVVAPHPLGDRRLRGDDLDRRVGVDGGHRGVEPWVRGAAHADAAVVAAHVVDQPLGGVVGVARLVHVLIRVLVLDVGADVHELALGHPSPAHVLEDGDVTGPEVREELGAPLAAERPGELVLAVRSYAVRRARHHDGVEPRRVLRDVDGGEEADPVPHRDLHLLLRIE